MSMAGGDQGLRALQGVQWRRKIALLMAFGIAVPALAFVNSYWREPWPAFYVSHRMGWYCFDSGMHRGTHVVHGLHRWS